MPRYRLLQPTFLSLLLVLAVAPTTFPSAQVFGGTEYTRFEPLFIAPAWQEALEREPHNVPALLNVPAGWSSGDAAAIVLFTHPGENGMRDRLVGWLLDQGAAVLELDSLSVRHSSTNGASPPLQPTPEGLLPDLFGALRALRQELGAEVVVAIGHGAGGAAAVLAAREQTAAAHLGVGGPRFTALVSLGPERAIFSAGSLPELAERWFERAAMLCAVSAFAVTPRGPSDATENECHTALAAR